MTVKKKKSEQSEQPKQIEQSMKTTARTKGTSRTIYFVDGSKVDKLITLLKKYPRANLSSMLNQLVEPLATALGQMTAGQRDVELKVKFWL